MVIVFHGKFKNPKDPCPPFSANRSSDCTQGPYKVPDLETAVPIAYPLSPKLDQPMISFSLDVL